MATEKQINAYEKTDKTVAELPFGNTTDSIDTEKNEKVDETVHIRRGTSEQTKLPLEQIKLPSEQIKLLYLGTVFMFAFVILLMVSLRNPDIYQIDEETLITINQAFNALVLLIIPFLLGILGAVSRIMIAGVKVAQQLSLVISSGIMASFSWVGIKSGVLLSIVAPHLEKQGVETTAVLNSPSDFYTMALVAILVGMFSTNLYLFINQKVEQLTQQSGQSNPNKKNQPDA
ncbi:hypothetical protein [Nitrosomonas sp. Nm166]|uniref:hypothetical protein n=1 Tax=Nitrosomonas sp. Nm166 TaxID=1881054 RepID=UPI0008DF4DE8|nr:hypothetical protein [Nitrosomonas sp. Nm166]SFF08553.1 hypothetical protein SAMN05428977_104814 [Nitrosomonas sp. Nm166]